MAELESQPLSDEERAELEELRAEKARREEQERLVASVRSWSLRAERAKADEPLPRPHPSRRPPRPNLSLKKSLVPSPSILSRAVTR
mgnify:CR=1 FL=1